VTTGKCPGSLFAKATAGHSRLQGYNFKNILIRSQHIYEEMGTCHCCDGLKSVSGPDIKDFDENCNPTSTGGLQICSNCGNKICDPETWENICNCPEDCR